MKAKDRHTATRRALALTALLLALAARGFGQGDEATEREAMAAFLAEAGNQAAIYNGPRESQYLFRLDGHPYLRTEEFREGEIRFDGRLYPNVRLRLNTHLDELVILSPDRRMMTVVPPDRMEEARVDTLLVRYLAPRGKDDAALAEGYYVRLTSGACPLWKRARKSLQERAEDMQLIHYFQERVDYYVERDGRFLPANSRRALLRALSDRRDALSQFIKREKLSFRGDNRERSLVRVALYYESLNP